MAVVVSEPRTILIDSSGTPYPGAKRYIYQAGTTTPLTVYADPALTTAHPVPQVADSSGVFAPAYLPGTVTSYRRVIQTSADALISSNGDVDNIPTGAMTQADIGFSLYPRTDAERTADITPSNYAYPSGDVRRYGAALDGTTDDSAAFNRASAVFALDDGPDLYIPPGTTASCVAVDRDVPTVSTR